jgi:type II protein arginine methyltransferase
MWRQTDDRKVWYEWIVEVFTSSSPQHPENTPLLASPSVPGQRLEKGKGKERERDGKGAMGYGGGERKGASTGAGMGRGRRTRIAATELHSSVKEACLM